MPEIPHIGDHQAQISSLQMPSETFAESQTRNVRTNWRSAIADAWLFVRMWITLRFAVYCDLCGFSEEPIPLIFSHQYWGNGPDAFVASCSDELGHRFVAWMYRWHVAPQPRDWVRWSGHLGINVPAHTLLLYRDGYPLGCGVTVRIGEMDGANRIATSSDCKRTARSVKFVRISRSELDRKLGVYSPNIHKNLPSYTLCAEREQIGQIQSGDLAPEQLIADSILPSAELTSWE